MRLAPQYRMAGGFSNFLKSSIYHKRERREIELREQQEGGKTEFEALTIPRPPGAHGPALMWPSRFPEKGATHFFSPSSASRRNSTTVHAAFRKRRPADPPVETDRGRAEADIPSPLAVKEEDRRGTVIRGTEGGRPESRFPGKNPPSRRKAGGFRRDRFMAGAVDAASRCSHPHSGGPGHSPPKRRKKEFLPHRENPRGDLPREHGCSRNESESAPPGFGDALLRGKPGTLPRRWAEPGNAREENVGLRKRPTHSVAVATFQYSDRKGRHWVEFLAKKKLKNARDHALVPEPLKRDERASAKAGGDGGRRG